MDTAMKIDKWKIISLIAIGLFIVTIFVNFAKHQSNMVELSDEEKNLAIAVATEALEGRITDDFTPTVRNTGMKVELENKQTPVIVFVQFSSQLDNRTYSVTVDLNGNKTLRICEDTGLTRDRNRPPPPPRFIF